MPADTALERFGCGALRVAALAGLGLATPRAAAAQAPAIDTLALKSHTMFLADDLLEGRGTGTRGERLAALYIAAQLERLGVPGGAADGGYFQPIPLRRALVDNERTRLELRRAGDTLHFKSGEHFIPNTGGSAAFRDFAGPALFAGTSEVAARALAGRGDVGGAVVVLLGAFGAEAVTLVPDLVRRGAAGVILLIADAQRFDVYLRSRGPSRYFLEAAGIGDPVWQPELPVLIAGPAVAASLLERVELSQDALAGRRPFFALPLAATVAATIRVEVEEVPAANVAGLIRGRDPARRDQVVAYSAHYDHLGIGTPDDRGDSIYNGFSDNAAGVAMLLAIAQELGREPPARSVLFLFFTGEERGLLGSTHYATAPLVPLERTVALINLDAGAPPAPPRSWNVAGGHESTLGALAAAVAAEHGWTAEPTRASPNSDYWPFLRRGVPAVFLIPGQEWAGVTKEEKEALVRRWERYHLPGDEWAPDFPFRGLQRYAELGLALGRAAANAAERPRRIEAGSQ